jgi:uncharacterized hydrophobic protein (TIGR00271 family)
VLQLRVYGKRAELGAVAQRLERLGGVRHVLLSDGGRLGDALVVADVRTDAADAALGVLDGLGVQPDDVVFVRLDSIGIAPDATTLVWADVLGQARLQARARGRYLALMAAAGVVGAFAVIQASPVLLVGAMAISPDLLPITAACTGIVLRRVGLAARGLGALAVGLAVTFVISAVLTALLDLFGLLPDGFLLNDIPAGQTHVGASTILVALSAGVAGMLAVETRASAAVGVAISVTTIPAVAYLGVALGVGELRHSLSALSVLAVNVAMMLIGGSGALAVQRALTDRRTARPAS